MFKIGGLVRDMMKKQARNAPTELEALLYVAIDILGRMALRKRDKLWSHDVRQLEDELFEVLEKLSNVCTSENSDSEAEVSNDGTP